MSVTYELPVNVDDIALSLRGYEVQEARARLVVTSYGDNTYSHDILLMITARFNPQDWTDCFAYDTDYPAGAVVIVSAPRISPLPAIIHFKHQENTSIQRWRLGGEEYSNTLLFDERVLRPEDLTVTLTAFDRHAAPKYCYGFPKIVQEIPIEIINTSTISSLEINLNATAFRVLDIHERGGDEYPCLITGSVSFQSGEAICSDYARINYGDPNRDLTYKFPIKQSLPMIFLEAVDATGFSLAQLDKYEIYTELFIHVNENKQLTYTRFPTFLIFEPFSDSDVSGIDVAKIICRIED